jgi:general secretion pathway protein A
MYVAHFELTGPPFAITPDPRFLYLSERHREGLAHLRYGIRQPGGFVQLTGEVGTGKTTLCRCLLEQLPPRVDVALILNPRLTSLEFLATVCDELWITRPPAPSGVKGLVDALDGYLLQSHALGRRTVLIVDEAQNLSADVLEQIRLLTNLETATEKLLQIILIGQPELDRLLERRELRQLAQRITARYHLRHFRPRETSAYIRHRLQVVGGSPVLFSSAAVRWVHHLSGGVPRLINVICDRALLGAYAHDRYQVDGAMVRRAAREVRGEAPRHRRLRRLAWLLGLGAVGAALLGVAILGAPSSLFP